MIFQKFHLKNTDVYKFWRTYAMRKEEIALELYNSAKENGFLDTIYEVIGPGYPSASLSRKRLVKPISTISSFPSVQITL